MMHKYIPSPIEHTPYFAHHILSFLPAHDMQCTSLVNTTFYKQFHYTLQINIQSMNPLNIEIQACL